MRLNVPAIPPAFARHAERNLPRYTSYPTALAFNAGVDEAAARRWAAVPRPDEAISVYVHTPFCDQLCWYCGCHTTVPNGYRRITEHLATLDAEIDLWAAALGPHAGAAHLHFGGGSPNALTAEDFAGLAERLKRAFRVRPDAEVAIELDPRSLTTGFIAAMGLAGVTRASLGVQTFDAAVQAKINRIQPFERVEWAAKALRRVGVKGISFDLMYGLPLQTPESVAESARLASWLRPDRVSVFGYAHVPWFKKHQKMIRDEELAGLEGRWAQADAADRILVQAGYVRVGLDHYALPDDELARAAAEGRLRRNFQGYTVDAADVLVPLGPSSIGQFPEGYVQNSRDSGLWARAVAQGRLAVDRGVKVNALDRLRACVIERIMCDLGCDIGALCASAGLDPGALDDGLARAVALETEGLCRVKDRNVSVAPRARRLVRAVAACFDPALDGMATRHSKAV